MRRDSPLIEFGVGPATVVGRLDLKACVVSPVGPDSPEPMPAEETSPDIERWEGEGGSIGK